MIGLGFSFIKKTPACSGFPFSCQFRVHHFLVQDVHNDVDNYQVIKDCIESSSVTQCYHLAEE